MFLVFAYEDNLFVPLSIEKNYAEAWERSQVYQEMLRELQEWWYEFSIKDEKIDPKKSDRFDRFFQAAYPEISPQFLDCLGVKIKEVPLG